MTLKIEISSHDVILQRHMNMLAALSQGQAKRAMARTLTHEGDKTTTAVRRAVAKQMGVSYGGISKSIKGQRATIGNLVYRIDGTGPAPNLKHFGGKQRSKGVHAKVWGRPQGPFRNKFGGSFIAKGRVYIRQSKGSLPVKQLFGPSPANEMVRDESMEALHDITPRLQTRLTHELMFMLMGGNSTGVKGK